MENLIINASLSPLPPHLARLLPSSINEALVGVGEIEELRLSVGRQAFVRQRGVCVPLGVSLDARALEEILSGMCGGSPYAHADNICRGFLSLGGGVRVGVCGRAVLEGGRVTGLCDISSLCIRIPHAITVDVSAARSLLARFCYTRGLLVYAPPAVGKTTYLRSLARALASGEGVRRVALVDTRDELSYSLDSSALCLDILSGYPKGYGIEIATRTLGADVIICDEIGGEEDARAILSVQSGGVPLVASAHAATLAELMRRGPMLSLHRAGVFGAYIGLARGREPLVTLAEDIDVDL